ncbi:MAG: hypothetical protein IT285_15840 [Bdellovibrionales bacterium]|nr:hypothetical protein [Bdellovibrionales bacterium]
MNSAGGALAVTCACAALAAVSAPGCGPGLRAPESLMEFVIHVVADDLVSPASGVTVEALNALSSDDETFLSDWDAFGIDSDETTDTTDSDGDARLYLPTGQRVLISARAEQSTESMLYLHTPDESGRSFLFNDLPLISGVHVDNTNTYCVNNLGVSPGSSAPFLRIYRSLNPDRSFDLTDDLRVLGADGAIDVGGGIDLAESPMVDGIVRFIDIYDGAPGTAGTFNGAMDSIAKYDVILNGDLLTVTSLPCTSGRLQFVVFP